MLARVALVAVALLARSSAVGQETTAEFASASVRTLNYSYAISVSSLDRVDFKNLQVFRSPGDPSGQSVKLRDGKYEYTSHRAGDHEEVVLEDVEVLKSPGGTEQYALILLYWISCGGSCAPDGEIQVFTLRDHHPTITQQIEYDRQAKGTGAFFNPMTGHLDIVGRAYDDSPNCCPRHLDLMRFDWDGKRFVPKASKRITSIEAETESIDPH